LLLLLPHAINGAESTEENEEKIPEKCRTPYESGTGTIVCVLLTRCKVPRQANRPIDARLVLTGAALLQVSNEGRIESTSIASDPSNWFREELKKVKDTIADEVKNKADPSTWMETMYFNFKINGNGTE
ncbi:hypothetical protein PMAYCL1PPCAC_14666, partial [Pristionchus mayeri]